MCAQAGKLDRGVESRPPFEADLHVNDIWASSLIQLSVVEIQAGNGDQTWEGAAGEKTTEQGDIKPQRSSHFSPHDAPLLECDWWDRDCLRRCVCLMDYGYRLCCL